MVNKYDNGWQKPDYDENFDIRQFTPKTKDDILRGFVELIKNSCDSYERKNKNKEYRDASIIIKYGSMLDKNTKTFQISDFAEGMSREEFDEALKVGAKSSGLDKVNTVTGSQGFGLKEACWAFQEASLYTIKNGNIIICEFKNTEKPLWKEIKNDKVTEQERKLTGINGNGTFIQGVLPPKDKIPQFRANTAYEKICKNFLLRKINTSSKFQIMFFDLEDATSTPKRIVYNYPEGVLKRDGVYKFEIEKYGKFNCNYKIYMTKKSDLENFGDTKECGLLVYYSEFSVLDNTLLGFDSHRLATKIFGEIKIDGPIDIMLNNNERIFGEKRKGMYQDHELYKKIKDGIKDILDAFLHTEERSMYDRSRDVSKNTVENINALLKEMNRIFKDETKEIQDIDVPNDKYRPKNGLSFCDYTFVTIIEFENKGIYLVADMNIIPDNSKIEIFSNSEDIKFSPEEIEFNKKDANERGICKRKVTLYSETPDAEGKITAKVKEGLNSTEILVKVKENPKLHFNGSLAFIPNEKALIDGKMETISLLIKNLIIKEGDKIRFNCEDDFLQFDKEIFVSKNNSKKLTKDISELSISLLGKGIDKKTKLKAYFGDEETSIDIEIISKITQKFRGYFKGIEEKGDEGTDELSHYDNGIIYIHTDHPMIQHYTNLLNYEEDISYRTFYADVVVRTFVGELVRKKLVDFSTGISARDQYLQELDKYYSKYSVRLHKLVISLETIKKLKIKKK